MKKNNKKKRKNIQLITLFLIVLLIIFAIILFIIIKQNKKTPQERTSAYVRAETIYPISISKFSEEYVGEINEEYIMEKITDFIYYIMDNKEYLDKINSQNINEEYEKNEIDLNELGIENLEQFNEFISKVQTIKKQELKYSYSEFKMDTLKISSSKTQIDLDIKFVEEEPITFKLEINNYYDKNEILVKFN